MRDLHRYFPRLLPALVLGALLSACGSPSGAAQPTSAPAPTTAPQPTSAPPPTAAPQPTTVPQPTATAQPAAGAPALFYIDQNVLYAQPIGGEPHRVADIVGSVLDAAVAGDTVLVLRAEGLVRIDLPDGVSTTLAKFDPPARAGSRLLVARDHKIFYAAWVDDPNAVFGKTHIGYYDIQQGNLEQLITVQSGAAPLGLAPDGDGLYLLPLGGDPSFGQIQIVDMGNGKVRADLPVEGEGMPMVSPDGRFLITTARRFSASDPNAEPENLLYLYDLSAKPIKPQVVTPPKAPSAAAYPFWSPDSSAFYFALGTGNIYELKESYGLWRYTIATNQPEPVSDVDILNAFFAQVNTQGSVLLRRTTQENSQLVDLASGKPVSFVLTPNAIVAGWR